RVHPGDRPVARPRTGAERRRRSVLRDDGRRAGCLARVPRSRAGHSTAEASRGRADGLLAPEQQRRDECDAEFLRARRHAVLENLFRPWILARLVPSFVAAILAIVAAETAFRVLSLKSAPRTSEGALAIERRAELVSTLFSVAGVATILGL